MAAREGSASEPVRRPLFNMVAASIFLRPPYFPTLPFSPHPPSAPKVFLLDADIFSLLDLVLRAKTGKWNKPFGGIALLAVGDPLQQGAIALNAETCTGLSDEGTAALGEKGMGTDTVGHCLCYTPINLPPSPNTERALAQRPCRESCSFSLAFCRWLVKSTLPLNTPPLLTSPTSHFSGHLIGP